MCKNNAWGHGPESWPGSSVERDQMVRKRVLRRDGDEGEVPLCIWHACCLERQNENACKWRDTGKGRGRRRSNRQIGVQTNESIACRVFFFKCVSLSFTFCLWNRVLQHSRLLIYHKFLSTFRIQKGIVAFNMESFPIRELYLPEIS